MPGEEVLAAAASSWSGPEALAIGALAVFAVLAFLGLWHHQRKCSEDMRRVHQRLDELAGLVGELKASMARLDERVRALDERSKFYLGERK